MTKLYKVKDLVVRCTTEEKEVEICTNIEAVTFLYREPVMEIVKRTSYRVEVIEWFGTEKETVLLDWSTFNKDEANRNFQIAYGQANM